ncbi:MAG: cytochrome ubiquinol oxidase subunit I [Candidatus Nanopelagicales bacterium]
MSNLDLGRIQFAMTSIYHFLFVPLTIGLAFLTAILQTRWHRTGNPELKRLTKFFGHILLINIAIGVVTGLVQEFQFGMNWSAYSRFVGDVFGAPLAMEGLAAFFLESTFLGLWLFGWDRLPARLHLATIWIVAVGTALSALFIMAANSWMQHPVGYEVVDGRASLNDIGAVFTNPVFIWGYLHVLLAAAVTASVTMLGVAAYHIRKGNLAFMTAAKTAMAVLLPSIILAMGVGSELGVIEAEYQPMKIAAAEAQWETCQPCSFSLFQIGGGNDDQDPTQILEVPYLLSILATNSPNGQVIGLNELQAQYEQQYGPGYYVPNVFVQYWSMRLMAYTAGAILTLAAVGVFLWWRKKLTGDKWYTRWFWWLCIPAVLSPFIMNTFGWMLTENGRQPWLVQGLMLTQDGVSPSVSATEVWISIAAFAAIYVVLGIVWATLMIRYARKGLHDDPDETSSGDDPDRAPALTY